MIYLSRGDRAMIDFNCPPVHGNEIHYLQQALHAGKLSGNGAFTERCHKWLKRKLPCSKVFLTTSCTHALEMAAILCDLQPGDEVIMPSYTFVSTANAFVLRGAKVVFVDIRPDTMNMDENLIEAAITPKTRAIVPVHYAGVACDMNVIMEIAKRYKLWVVEDAAQGFLSKYQRRNLGTIGHLGCYSFHETKNITCGEGGAIVINDDRLQERAEYIWEKGTNRATFFRGQVDKYTWVDIGSSYLPSELNAAYLYGQMEVVDTIYRDRMQSWKRYHEELDSLVRQGYLDNPSIPQECEHNAHMYYIKLKDLKQRTAMIEYLKANEVVSVFHYVPLHSSPFGRTVSRFSGEDRYTTLESERLTRLPLYYGMSEKDLQSVIRLVKDFFSKH
jgi:dTDP-4-amino-4,6-dideoxygalactose transaminase